MTDGRFVSWDRWDATNQAITQRVADLEGFAARLEGAEQQHRAMQDRIAALEKAGAEDEAGERTRRDRVWLLALTLFSGVVFPILVTALITFLHLKAQH